MPAIRQRVDQAANGSRAATDCGRDRLPNHTSASANARIKQSLTLPLRVVQRLHGALSGTSKRRAAIGLGHYRVDHASALERSTAGDGLHGLSGDIARNAGLGCH